MENHQTQNGRIPLYNVSEITYLIKAQLEEQFSLVRIKGEISTFRKAASGHCYFNLKDRDSVINGVLFRYQKEQLEFQPADGQAVIVLGRLSVYPQRGNYQIICETMEKVGQGDLLLLLEERKKKLAAQGLFDDSRKRPLPLYPEKIGVVTSAKGAALQDIIQVLKRRMGGFTLCVYDSLVQGDKAPESLVAGLEYFNAQESADVLLLARGGGSVEDLLAFSEEAVVRAVAASAIPVITGIGHEIDFSLSDFAADLRAATPSAAAEILSQSAVNVQLRVGELKESLLRSAGHQLETSRWRLNENGPESLRRLSLTRLDTLKLHLDAQKAHMTTSKELYFKSCRHRLDRTRSAIQAQSPEKILEKGFSLILKEDRIIRRAEDLAGGDKVTLKLRDGEKGALIQGEKNEKL